CYLLSRRPGSRPSEAQQPALAASSSGGAGEQRAPAGGFPSRAVFPTSRRRGSHKASIHPQNPGGRVATDPPAHRNGGITALASLAAAPYRSQFPPQSGPGGSYAGRRAGGAASG